MKKGKILVVDDNAGIRSALKILLPIHFAGVETISSPNLIMSAISSFKPDVVLLDMNFSRDINTGNEGLFWLSEIKKRYNEVQVVLFTAYADINLAVEGMKRGAADFVVKPWDNEKLVGVLCNVLEKSSGLQSSAGKRGMANDHNPSSREVETMRWGNSGAMQEIKRMVDRVAGTDATVLITGENGVGKDLLASEIERKSPRSGKPMVCVDLGAVTESLFESELFGHVKGAFTDAKNDHAGKFEQADGGTLFLDEIGNIPLHLQAKLLRVLQNRSIVRVGGNSSISIDIRLICATNKNLPKMVAEGKFREDLYYRINTVEIHLPPLRERKDEIIPLAEMFLMHFAEKYGRKAKCFTPKAAEMLLSNRWNGNIRELRNCVEKAVIVSEEEAVNEKDLMILAGGEDAGGADAGQYRDEPLEVTEERAIRAAMRRYDGNLSLVARSLNISRPTLYSKLKKYNI